MRRMAMRLRGVESKMGPSRDRASRDRKIPHGDESPRVDRGAVEVASSSSCFIWLLRFTAFCVVFLQWPSYLANAIALLSIQILLVSPGYISYTEYTVTARRWVDNIVYLKERKRKRETGEIRDANPGWSYLWCNALFQLTQPCSR